MHSNRRQFAYSSEQRELLEAFYHHAAPTPDVASLVENGFLPRSATNHRLHCATWVLQRIVGYGC
jgi:hypothetical protein